MQVITSIIGSVVSFRLVRLQGDTTACRLLLDGILAFAEYRSEEFGLRELERSISFAVNASASSP